MRHWYGPLWPLGPFILSTPGTGTAITDGLSDADLESSEYVEGVCRGFIVSCPSTNTQPVYLVQRDSDGTYSKNNPGTVVLTVEPGQTKQFPEASFGSNRYLFKDYGLDNG